LWGWRGRRTLKGNSGLDDPRVGKERDELRGELVIHERSMDLALGQAKKGHERKMISQAEKERSRLYPCPSLLSTLL
jgi:hypothetical protein